MVTEKFSIVIPGDPKSKARPRFSKGHAYQSHRSMAMEDSIRHHLRKALPWEESNSQSAFGTEIRFFTATWQRKDLDNMVKLVWDACTGIVWKDDSQVMELRSTLERGVLDPRVEVDIWLIDKPLHRTVACEICQTPIRIYNSVNRRFCSPGCTMKSQKTRRVAQCEFCGKVIERHVYRVSGRRFCSRECHYATKQQDVLCMICGARFARPKSESWRIHCSSECASVAKSARPLRSTAGLGQCERCGGATSRKRNKYCAGCVWLAKKEQMDNAINSVVNKEPF